jgi:hypothetical protein
VVVKELAFMENERIDAEKVAEDLASVNTDDKRIPARIVVDRASVNTAVLNTRARTAVARPYASINANGEVARIVTALTSATMANFDVNVGNAVDPAFVNMVGKSQRARNVGGLEYASTAENGIIA